MRKPSSEERSSILGLLYSIIPEEKQTTPDTPSINTYLQNTKVQALYLKRKRKKDHI